MFITFLPAILQESQFTEPPQLLTFISMPQEGKSVVQNSAENEDAIHGLCSFELTLPQLPLQFLSPPVLMHGGLICIVLRM